MITETEHPDLPKEQIHIWRVPLSQPPNVLSRLEQLLDPEERQRAARFHFPKDRIRYTVAHGALRTILAGYLGARPGELCFQRGRFGKPYLSAPTEETGNSRAADQRELGKASAASPPPGLHFNLSHCEDLALVAVSRNHPVGVDVEKVRDISNLDRIVDRYFSVDEKRFLQSALDKHYSTALLILWSRREAAAKALGLDLTAALSTVKVPAYQTGGETELAHFAELQTDRGEKRPLWTIRDLELDQGHLGAVCAAGSAPKVVLRDFQA